ncbi:MAG: cytochrome c oxidase subunit 3 family protein [Bryobacterales bacterium]|nr:cytochrome c oxidase subunit 3 family protein [Bryobacterales bacterium]
MDTHALESPALRHHFDTAEQQKDASTLGMWIFLVTEIMFFGGLFAGYTVYRQLYPNVFAAASNELDILLGGVNTAVLIFSSFTMVLAVWSAQTGSRKGLMVNLVLTMLLGLVFLVIKGFEWHHKWVMHEIPGASFHWEGPNPGQAQLFFSLYFAMTGLHALHMVVGIGILSLLLYMAWRGRFSRDYYTPVDTAGLYWHFVDIIWIFLFPLLYLIGRHHHG